MYIPKHFSGKNKEHAIQFIERFNFGILISTKNSRPIGSHLPFLVSERNDELILTSHFARANEQSFDFESKEILAIFSEPHAYVSPNHYERKENVPTWNYVSVHAYGITTLINDYEGVISVLETTINRFDPEYIKQWNELSEEYKNRMTRGIVAFEIRVTELQFNEKLSQNKTIVERRNISEALSNSKDSNEVHLAEMMRQQEENKP